jgi:hypothetical protein
MNKESYRRTFGSNPNVQVILGFELPSTFDLLVRADFHMSIASAAHYDALGLGVPTIVLPLVGHELVQQLIDDGHAYLSKTPKDLLSYLLQSRGKSVPPELSAYYFKPGAIQNMHQELGQLL